MEIMGLEFAPLNIPLKRRLQTLATTAWFIIFAFGGFAGLILTLYLLLFTSIWSAVLLYLIWVYFIDYDTCDKGGRAVKWVRDWSWWYYLRDYFPLRLERVPWVNLDPKKNYLFACFPHGMLSTGVFSAFATEAGGFHHYFPFHKPHICTLHQHFQMPIFRELSYSLGGINASEKSLNYVLGKPGGGNVAAIVVGGAAEAFNCRPRQYKLVLKKRKGFCKVALQNGSPLVPVFSFGETDLFDQVQNPEGSTIRKIQEWLKKRIGLAPAIPLGRGIFQYNYGIVPHRRPVTTVVGRPIEVQKLKEPTREQVQELHEKFIKELVKLFEEEKHRYIKDADDIHLEFE